MASSSSKTRPFCQGAASPLLLASVERAASSLHRPRRSVLAARRSEPSPRRRRRTQPTPDRPFRRATTARRQAPAPTSRRARIVHVDEAAGRVVAVAVLGGVSSCCPGCRRSATASAARASCANGGARRGVVGAPSDRCRSPSSPGSSWWSACSSCAVAAYRRRGSPAARRGRTARLSRRLAHERAAVRTTWPSGSGCCCCAPLQARAVDHGHARRPVLTDARGWRGVRPPVAPGEDTATDRGAAGAGLSGSARTGREHSCSAANAARTAGRLPQRTACGHAMSATP